MFFQINPQDALELLKYVFAILGTLNILLNSLCLLCVVKLTSKKFSYFTTHGVVLMATNILVSLTFIVLKPAEVIIYGHVYTLFLSEFLPNIPCLYYFFLELLQLQLIYFGIYTYLTMIIRYQQQHLVPHCLAAAFSTELIIAALKGWRISFGHSADEESISVIKRFIRQDYDIHVVESMDNSRALVISESAVHVILLATTVAFAGYLYYFLSVATPDNVLSKKMFFSTRLRMNIRISVFTIHGCTSFPLVARNFYQFQYPGSTSVTPFPFYVLNLLAGTSVPLIFLLSYYYGGICDRLRGKRVFPSSGHPSQNVLHVKEAWPV